MVPQEFNPVTAVNLTVRRKSAVPPVAHFRVKIAQNQPFTATNVTRHRAVPGKRDNQAIVRRDAVHDRLPDTGTGFASEK